MKSYSPYDNLSKRNYPNILVVTGLHDSQVQYFEPAKYVAKLRELKTDKNLLSCIAIWMLAMVVPVEGFSV
jgi:oligopeptidase B